MTLVLTAPPAQEPILLADAKAQLRVDSTAEDVLIGSLMLTSRLHIEAALGLALITQSWQLTLDDFPPDAAITLPMQPIAAVTGVQTVGADGTVSTLPPSAYLFDPGRPPRLIRTAKNWPHVTAAANGVVISFTAGYGPNPSDVPLPIRQAMLLLVAHWYEHRDPIEIGQPDTAIPKAVSDLLAAYRGPRL